jgi:hypothetical protein
MRQSVFDFVGNLDTLLAVVVGAALATIGGLIGEHFEDQIERRRRARDAARFFGEILASIDSLIDRGVASQKIGDPWGPVTQRFFRTAMREAEVYERNRERLFDLHDNGLRAAIHTHVISEIFPLEAVLDGCEKIAALAAELDERADLSPERRQRLESRLEEMKRLRAAALEFIVQERAKTDAIRQALERRAGVSLRVGPAQPGSA